MKKFLLCVVALLAVSVGLVAKEVVMSLDNGTVLTLGDAPCSSKTVLAMIDPKFHEMFQDGRAAHSGRTVNLCWSGTALPGFVAVADEDGNTGVIPNEALKRPMSF